MGPNWKFYEAQHPPRPPAGEIGVYTGAVQHGSTTRLVYRHRGIHVTVTEARGRYTMTARWAWKEYSWTYTEMAIDEYQAAVDTARTYIEILCSIAASFDAPSHDSRIEAVTAAARRTLDRVRGELDTLEKELP